MYGKVNDPINVGEVNKAILKLQNNKACVMDQMINNFFKASSSLLATTLTGMFNLIIDSGIVPLSWPMGMIKPLYKSKGGNKNPENNRDYKTAFDDK